MAELQAAPPGPAKKQGSTEKRNKDGNWGKEGGQCGDRRHLPCPPDSVLAGFSFLQLFSWALLASISVHP
jgi:hypothetical protein